MSTEQYNYLSLEDNKDKNEPFMTNNSEDNFLSNIKTIKTEENQEVKKDELYYRSSSDEESSHGENKADIYKKQQDELLKN